MTFNFLLYSCSSADGRCVPVYQGQTSDDEEAIAFLEEHTASIYDTAAVRCHDDREEHTFSQTHYLENFLRIRKPKETKSIQAWLTSKEGTVLRTDKLLATSRGSHNANVLELVECARFYNECYPQDLKVAERRVRVIDLIGHASEELTELRQHISRKHWKAEQPDLFTDEEHKRLALLEIADVLLFLDCIRHYAGYSVKDVLAGVAQKLEFNLTRPDHVHDLQSERLSV